MKESGLFDPAWYARRYPDVVGEGIDPALHYAVHGGREGRWPHPLFHGDLYLDTVPGLRAEGANPLLHYVERGAEAGIRPNPLFDPDWYAERYLGGAGHRARAFFHFLRSAETDPSPLFDTAWYRSRYPDARAAGGDALSHYYETGRKQGYLRTPEEFAGLSRHVDLIRRSGLFDAAFYRARCPEAETSGLEPLEHYVMAGGYRRYAPHPLFDRDWYAAQSAAVRADSLNPLVHFLEHGADEGLDPGPWFDTRWYRDTYLADEAAGPNPLAHFLADGGRTTSPSPRFDAPWYLARYPKVAALGLNPLVDYVVTGLEAGRLTRRVAGTTIPEAADARLSCLKREPRRHTRTALFITHAPEGRIRGHVEPYLRAFAENGTDIVLIIAADQHKNAVPQAILDLCASVYLRENRGFDFAAWAHVLLEDDDILDSETLYLANDSLVGPLDRGRLRRAAGEDRRLPGGGDRARRQLLLQSPPAELLPGPEEALPVVLRVQPLHPVGGELAGQECGDHRVRADLLGADACRRARHAQPVLGPEQAHDAGQRPAQQPHPVRLGEHARPGLPVREALAARRARRDRRRGGARGDRRARLRPRPARPDLHVSGRTRSGRTCAGPRRRSGRCASPSCRR